MVGTWLLTPEPAIPAAGQARGHRRLHPASGGRDRRYRRQERSRKPIIKRLQPYLDGKKQPKLLNYYVKMNGPGFMDMAVRVPNDEDFPTLEKIVRSEIIKDLPDAQAFAQMGSLFGGFDAGGGVSINIQSNDADAMRAAARKGMDLLTQKFPEGVVNTNPTLDYDQPQLQAASRRPLHRRGRLDARRRRQR